MRAVAVAGLTVAAFLPQLAVAQAPVHSAAAVKWGPGPDFLPHGAKFAVIQGDPSQSGEYTIRLKLPDHYKFPPHYHPTDEHVTVLSGKFLVGMGDTANYAHATTLTAGGFITAPKDAHHFASARGVTILQVSGEGPFKITYVKDSDDPRNAKPKTE
ncbi:MAG TPA: cupin domain-containing protein [Gemmatimonadales bacterium]|nr:cupin domain-containing protein [Gemmatimonadales bacterium]